MDERDQATHLGMTRLQAKLEALTYAQAEALARLDIARLQREGRWPRTDAAGDRAMTR